VNISDNFPAAEVWGFGTQEHSVGIFLENNWKLAVDKIGD
jgi:hypothetical protein